MCTYTYTPGFVSRDVVYSTFYTSLIYRMVIQGIDTIQLSVNAQYTTPIPSAKTWYLNKGYHAMPTAINAMNNLQLKNAGSKHHISVAAQVILCISQLQVDT